jgi:hypothetical protein
MDSYGITPKGQQDRRWLRPEAATPSRFTRDEPARQRMFAEQRSAKERFRALVDESQLAATGGSYRPRDARLTPTKSRATRGTS